MTIVRNNSWKKLWQRLCTLSKTINNTDSNEVNYLNVLYDDLCALYDTFLLTDLDENWAPIPASLICGEKSILLTTTYWVMRGDKTYTYIMAHSHETDQAQINLPIAVDSGNVYVPIRKFNGNYYLPCNTGIDIDYRLGGWIGYDVIRDIDWTLREELEDTETVEEYKHLLGIANIHYSKYGQVTLDKFIERCNTEPQPIILNYGGRVGSIYGYILEAVTDGNGINTKIITIRDRYSIEFAEYVLDLMTDVHGCHLRAKCASGITSHHIYLAECDPDIPNDVYCAATGIKVGYIDSYYPCDMNKYKAILIFDPINIHHMAEIKKPYLTDVYIQIIDGKYQLVNSVTGLLMKRYLEQQNESN